MANSRGTQKSLVSFWFPSEPTKPGSLRKRKTHRPLCARLCSSLDSGLAMIAPFGSGPIKDCQSEKPSRSLSGHWAAAFVVRGMLVFCYFLFSSQLTDQRECQATSPVRNVLNEIAQHPELVYLDCFARADEYKACGLFVCRDS